MPTSRRYQQDSFSPFFKKLRKESGFSLEKLSDKTKIQKKYLEYLEAGNFHALPPEVYVRGFILKCSSFFSTENCPRLMFLYARESSMLKAVPTDGPLTLNGRSFSFTPHHLTVIITTVFLLSLLVYFAVNFIPFLFKPEIYLLHPQKENLVVNFANITIEGTAKYAQSLTFNGEELYIEENGTFRDDIALREGVNILRFRAENRFGRKIEVVRRVVYIRN